MNYRHIAKTLPALLLGISLGLVCAPVAEAGALYHAASKTAARSIVKNGFSKAHFKPQARFGKGVYLTRSAKTALREKPKAQALVVVRPKAAMSKRLLDTRKAPLPKLKAMAHLKDGRGAIKHGVIGPQLAKKVGRYAARTGRPLAYRSARDPHGTNLFIPARVSGSDLYRVGSVRPLPQRKVP